MGRQETGVDTGGQIDFKVRREVFGGTTGRVFPPPSAATRPGRSDWPDVGPRECVKTVFGGVTASKFTEAYSELVNGLASRAFSTEGDWQKLVVRARRLAAVDGFDNR